MADKIFLTAIADDFGMHKAVNEGIVDTFLNGLLTDSNIMASCEAFDEAVQLSKEHKIPVGLHPTFYSDFDKFRPQLDEFQTPGTELFHWGRRNRVLDYQLLMDSEVKDWIEELNIKMTPISEVPFSKAKRKF